jgi:hypothetical protein
VRGAAFISGGLVLSSSDDGTSKLWNPDSSELVATLLSFGGSDDWLVITPDGLFDGTADAMQLVAWRSGSGLVPLDTLYDDFYHPDLLGEISNGERPKPVVDVATVLRLPGLRAMQEQGLAHVERPDGKTWLCVAEGASPAAFAGLQVYTAGTPVDIAARELLDDRSDVRCLYRKQLPDSLGPLELIGVTRARATALGSAVTTPAMSTTRNSVLHVYSVGITTYNPSVRYANSGTLPPLPYATADAEAVKTFFVTQRERGKSVFRDIRVTLRSNAEATRQAIRDDLSRLARETREEDVVCLFFAGHGRVPLGQEMFYFMPSTPPPSDPLSAPLVEERDVGISTAMLADAVRALRARRVVVVIDSCQLGGAVESLQKIGEVKAAVERRRSSRGGPASRGVAGATGVYVLAAAHAGGKNRDRARLAAEDGRLPRPAARAVEYVW